MTTRSGLQACPLCGDPVFAEVLEEALWAAPDVIDRITQAHPGWVKRDGACPACLQQVLLELLLNRGEEGLHESIQKVWPLDAEAAYGALPTPLRMHGDPHYSGAGITLALIDSAFYPHPDLVEPVNRIRAWVDASADPPRCISFGPEDKPRWPGWDAASSQQWHGLMTSAVAAGNGWLSHGLYRGLASDADVVLIQVSNAEGRIPDDNILRALRWLAQHGAPFNVRVASLSVAGDAWQPGNPIDETIRELVAADITVVAAAGNDGRRRLVPPASAAEAVTVGGLDDHNTFDHAEMEMWHSNYGSTVAGQWKPEVVAPSMWVVAPLLPIAPSALDAIELFQRRAAGDQSAEQAIAERRLIRPEYQLVEGTSFAAPIVASLACCMLQANPSLTAMDVRKMLLASSTSIQGAPPERQGAGAVDAGQAVALALRGRNGALEGTADSPNITPERIEFFYRCHGGTEVRVLGSWDGWKRPGISARQLRPGVWSAAMPHPRDPRHAYKLLVDGMTWVCDPSNPRRVPDGLGGFNSVLVLDRVTD